MDKKYVAARGSLGAFGAGTQAVRAGNIVFVGGLMSLDNEGHIVGSDIGTQARNVFDALSQVLADAGASMTDVVKHNVYFHNDRDDADAGKFMEELNRVRVEYFSDPGPTTTEVEVGLDRDGALILVDAWAVIGVDKQLLAPEGHWGWSSPLPFSQGWKVGDFIFVGGQRSLDATGKLLGAGDIEVQTAKTFGNLEIMLREGGGDRNNLMRQNTYFRFQGQGRAVTDYWERMNKVRRQYMSIPSAAGAGLRIPGFPAVHGASSADELIQVEGIAVLGDDKQRLMPADHWDWSIADSQFTQGWRIGDLVFVGGQISADEHAKAVGEGMEAQARNVFQFIRNTLHEASLDENDVVKLYVYYHAEGDWEHIAEAVDSINSVRREFYEDPGPAVTAVRVSGFAFEDLLIEVEALAVVRG